MSITPDPAHPEPIPTNPEPIPTQPASSAAAAVTPAVAPVAVLPPENVTRGTIFALAIVPAGIIVWIIVALIGFISGIVALGIALGALALYRLGSGGRISFIGAIRVSVIIVATLIASYLGSIIALNDAYLARALRTGRFFEGLIAAATGGGGDTVINILLVVVFAVLGVFTVFRTANTQAKQDRATTTV